MTEDQRQDQAFRIYEVGKIHDYNQTLIIVGLFIVAVLSIMKTIDPVTKEILNSIISGMLGFMTGRATK